MLFRASYDCLYFYFSRLSLLFVSSILIYVSMKQMCNRAKCGKNSLFITFKMLLIFFFSLCVSFWSYISCHCVRAFHRYESEYILYQNICSINYVLFYNTIFVAIWNFCYFQHFVYFITFSTSKPLTHSISFLFKANTLLTRDIFKILYSQK